MAASTGPISSPFLKALLKGRLGRLNRADYCLLLVTILALEELLKYILPVDIMNGWIVTILITLMIAVVIIHRLHDCGVSGWWVLVYFMIVGGAEILLMISFMQEKAPVISTLLLFPVWGSLLLISLWPGQKYENKYGTPYEGSAFIKRKLKE